MVSEREYYEERQICGPESESEREGQRERETERERCERNMYSRKIVRGETNGREEDCGGILTLSELRCLEAASVLFGDLIASPPDQYLSIVPPLFPLREGRGGGRGVRV
jgi:hypothetical protein